MDIKTKKILFTFLYVMLIVGLLAFMIWIVFWLKSESAICLKDPMNYYANKTSQICYCSGKSKLLFQP